MDIAFLSIRRFPLKGETRFVFWKNHFFENGYRVVIYFIFLRENKIRKKALNVTPNMEKRV